MIQKIIRLFKKPDNKRFAKLGDELNGLRFDIPFERLFYMQHDGVCGHSWGHTTEDLHNTIEYLIERVRRAEGK